LHQSLTPNRKLLGVRSIPNSDRLVVAPQKRRRIAHDGAQTASAKYLFDRYRHLTKDRIPRPLCYIKLAGQCVDGIRRGDSTLDDVQKKRLEQSEILLVVGNVTIPLASACAVALVVRIRIGTPSRRQHRETLAKATHTIDKGTQRFL